MSPRVGSPAPGVELRLHERRQPPETRLVPGRRVLADEGTPPVVVLGREERVERYVRIAVESVAVGEGELRALGDDVDELCLGELSEVESRE